LRRLKRCYASVKPKNDLSLKMGSGSVSLVKMADLVATGGDRQAALWLRYCLAICEKLVAADPGNVECQVLLTSIYERIGKVLTSAARSAAAREINNIPPAVDPPVD
jgi:hypothetical protein